MTKKKKHYEEPTTLIHALAPAQIICTSGGDLPPENKVEDMSYTDEEWNLN